MDRRDVLKRLLYPKCKTAVEFKFDTLIANPMLTYITVQDIAQLNKIATSIKYSSKPKVKYKMIDNILVPRGFKKMASGTNRVVYRYLNDYRVVLKVAIDKVGLSDNGNEYKNQQLLKPFVSKCFEVSPCGTVGLFERVVPITSREEFINLSDSIFDLINNIIGKYVLEDIGEKFYMNYGLREGFGPVLLDYPYVFELDGRKLICNVEDPLEPKGYCGGEIDYDLGYNDLVCKKCGKRYLATELKKPYEKSGKPKIIIEGDDTIMKCVLKRGDVVVNKLNSEEPISTNTIPPRKQYDKMKSHIAKNNKYGKKNNKGYHKQNINKKDDVHLQARIKGYPKGKNIDKEAREAERKAYEVVKSVPVSFDLDKNQEIVNEVSTISVVDNEGLILNKDNVSIKEGKSIPKCKPIPRCTINENGDVFDENGKIIAYCADHIIQKNSLDNEESFTDKVDETQNEITEDENNFDDEETTEYDDIYEEKTEEDHLTIPIGDMIKNTLNSNDNYKIKSVTSPIENHYSNKGIRFESEIIPQKVEDEKNEIPNLIIHPRVKDKNPESNIEKINEENIKDLY